MRPFCHLHLHTQYSLLDGATGIDSLMDWCVQHQMPSVAITDHGNMFGAMEFYFAAKKKNIKPLIGCEVYICTGSRFDKRGKKTLDTVSADRSDDPSEANILNHLILLAKNQRGYENLCQLVTSGFTEGFYYKPRIDKELLSAYAGDLVALTSCIKGEIPFWLTKGKGEFAEEACRFYKDLFGDDFYLEVQNHGIPDQIVANRGIEALAAKYGIKICATNDAHYLRRQDAIAQDILLCLQTGSALDDPTRLKFPNDEFYVKNGDEMALAFPDHPEYLDNTLEVADKCSFQVVTADAQGKPIYHLPQFPVKTTVEETLAEDAKQGLTAYLAKHSSKCQGKEDIYHQRLADETAMIQKTGFSGYFLIVADFIRWAKEQGIPVGPGRGSGAGSLVAMSLGITDVDPLEYNLLFERFINPERISMPDFDIDFCQERRGEVIQYVANKYGKDKVAQIATFGKLLARGVLKDTGKTLGVPFGEMNQVTKLVPKDPKITLEEAFNMEPELKALEASNPRLAQVFQVGRALEGSIKSAGRHAAGVIITQEPLTKYCPLFLSKDGETVTQYDKDWSEKIGLVKFDFLGLKNLTVISRAEKMIQQFKPEFSVANLDYRDPAMFQLVAKGDCAGLFQLESSSGMAELGIRLQPTGIEDIIAMVALFRPGPMAMIDDFVDRKHGRQATEYLFPELEPILKETCGIMLYQEQVMSIARVIAGYSLGEADLLRRAMGKKKADEMEKHRSKFTAGAVAKGFDQAKAALLFEQMAKFADYGFNKSHAAAYALITYQTGFLKAYYPAEYYAALLSTELDNLEKLTKYIADANAHGIKILPPDVNESQADFAVVQGNVRFGLGAIKGVGSGIADEIIRERATEGSFEDIFDFCVRLSGRINKKTLEALVSVGALDRLSLKYHRNQVLLGIDRLLKYGVQKKEAELNGQQSLFGEGDASGVPKPDLQEAPVLEERARLRLEKDLVGFYITGHPLNRYKDLMTTVVTMTTSKAAEVQAERLRVTMFGLVGALRVLFTKKTGEKMASFVLEDAFGTMEAVAYPNAYKEVETYLQMPEEPLVIKGELDTESEKPRLVVQSVLRAEDYVPAKVKEVRLKVSAPEETRVSDEQFAGIRFWAKKYPGDVPVRLALRMGAAEVVLKLPDRVSVHADACCEIMGMMGKNVELVQ